MATGDFNPCDNGFTGFSDFREFLWKCKSKKSLLRHFSVLSNTTLVILKLIVGVIIGSVYQYFSEAIHSGVDLLAAIIALLAVRKSRKPELGHAYGHGKYENLSGAIEALLIFVAGAWIIFEAIHKLIKPQPIEAVGWGIGVMLFSSVVTSWFHTCFSRSVKKPIPLLCKRCLALAYRCLYFCRSHSRLIGFVVWEMVYASAGLALDRSGLLRLGLLY